MVKIQEVEESNIGRFCTLARWNIEFQIAVGRNRYAILARTIGYNVVHYCGGMLGFITSTHNQFGIGKIKPNPFRKYPMFYMSLTKKYWFKKHPIPDETFSTQLLLIRSKSKNYVEIKDLQDLQKYWDETQIQSFNLTKQELIIKGGGVGNYIKSIYNMKHSEDVLRIFIGINVCFCLICIQFVYKVYTIKIQYKLEL